MTAWHTLVQPDALHAALDDPRVVVVDCRFSLADPDAGARAYAASHMPGARYAHLDHDLSDHRKQEVGRHPWPDAGDFTARLGRWGISPAHQVVAYDDGDGAHAARLWFLLRTLGHHDVAVLDGGWARWQALGLPVQSTVSTAEPALYDAAFDSSRLLDAARVQAHLAAGGVLLDARAPERFRGDVEPLDRVAGHVPGAINHPYAGNLSGGAFKTPDALRRDYVERIGDADATDVVAMCGSGVTACHLLLAMAHAGLGLGRLYTGSWSGWISDPGRPVAVGDDH